MIIALSLHKKARRHHYVRTLPKYVEMSYLRNIDVKITSYVQWCYLRFISLTLIVDVTGPGCLLPKATGCASQESLGSRPQAAFMRCRAAVNQGEDGQLSLSDWYFSTFQATSFCLFFMKTKTIWGKLRSTFDRKIKPVWYVFVKQRCHTIIKIPSTYIYWRRV